MPFSAEGLKRRENAEKKISKELNKIDELMLSLREKVRRGELVESIDLTDIIKT